MRILLVSGIYPPDIGGPATHAADVRAELVARGHSVTVLTLTDGSSVVSDDGIVRVPRRWPWARRSAVMLLWIARRRHRFDVVYATGLAPVAVAGAAVAGRPVVLKIVADPAWERATRLGETHATFEEFQQATSGTLRIRLMRGVRNWTVRSADQVVAPSPQLVDAVWRWGRGRNVVLVPNGARHGTTIARAGTGERKSGPVDAVFVGRLVPVKDVALLVEAVARTPDVRLEVIGDGPEFERLRELAARIAAGRVTFRGAIDHAAVLSRLAAADVLVLASAHEGLPHVALEALVAGTPVVAVRSEGLAQIVDHDDNGLLCDRSAAALGAALGRLVGEPGLRERLASGAAASGQRWTFDHCADRLERVLNDAAGTRKPRAVFVGKSAIPAPPRPEDLRKYAINERYLHATLICTGKRAGRYELAGATVVAFGHTGAAVVDSLIFYTAAPLLALASTCGRASVCVVCQSPYEAVGVEALRGLVPRHLRPRVQVELHGDWRTAGRLYGGRCRRMIAPMADRAAAWALRRADRVRPVSEVLAALAREVGYTGPIDRHVAFSDYEEFLAPSVMPVPERPRVIFVGVLERYKALDVLLEAWPMVATVVPEARLLIVGDGRLRGAIRERVERGDFGRRVELLLPVPRPRLRELIDDSSCLVLPSRSEGLPRIVLEAMARARAVVATDVGGLAELVADGVNGWLVPPEDPVRLAAALREALADPARLEAMGRASRRVAESRDPATEYEDGIRRLADWIARPVTLG